MSHYFDVLNRNGRGFGPSPVAAPLNGDGLERTRGSRQSEPDRAAPSAGYDTLAERLLVAANGNPLRVLVFAGCEGGEGCTHVVQGYADMLAASGLRVLLIDADARSASLTERLDAPGPDLWEAVTTDTTPPGRSWGKGTLTVVGSPRSAPDGTQFLLAPTLLDWLQAQRSRYDYVLLDAPPLLRCAEGTHLGRRADGVVLVVRADTTNRDLLVRAKEQLQRAEVNVVGVVLNGARNPVPAPLRRYLSSELE